MNKIIYLVITFIFFVSIELYLRYLGFGDPIIYINSENNNYYPRANQETIRYKGAKIKAKLLSINDFSTSSLDILFEISSSLFGVSIP